MKARQYGSKEVGVEGWEENDCQMFFHMTAINYGILSSIISNSKSMTWFICYRKL